MISSKTIVYRLGLLTVLTGFGAALLAEEMKEVAPKKELTPFNPVPRTPAEKAKAEEEDSPQEAKRNFLERLTGLDLGRSSTPQVDYLAPTKPKRELDPRTERKIRLELDKKRNWLLENAGRLEDGDEEISQTESSLRSRGMDRDELDTDRRSVTSLQRLNRALGKERLDGQTVGEGESRREARQEQNRLEGREETVQNDPMSERSVPRPYQARSLFGKAGPEESGGGVRIGLPTRDQDGRLDSSVERAGASERDSILGNLALFDGASQGSSATDAAKSSLRTKRVDAFEQLLKGSSESGGGGAEGFVFSRSQNARSQSFEQLLGSSPASGGSGIDFGSSPASGSSGSLFGNPGSPSVGGGVQAFQPRNDSLPSFNPSPVTSPNLGVPAFESPVSAPARIEPRPVFLGQPTRGLQ